MKMKPESDPYVLYGGDPVEGTEIDDSILSLGSMIQEDLSFGETRNLFINGMTNKVWTYRDLLDQSSLAAKAMHGAGLRRNDVVSIIAENRHEFPAAAFGAFYLNAIVAPVNVTYTERELGHALSLSKPKIVFVSPFAARRTVAVCEKLSFVKHVVLFGDKNIESSTILYEDFIKKFSQNNFDVARYVKERIDIKEQVALIVCSSGTTGLPKGVLITQLNMISVLQSYRGLFTLMQMIHENKFVAMNIAPWFHALGFMSMFMVACSRETTFVFLPKFEEELFLKSIETYKVNGVTVVPPIMVFLAKSPLFDKYDLSSLTNIGCGAATLTKEVEDQVRERFGGNMIIRQGYGLSETTLGVLGTNSIMKAGSVGEPLQGVYVKVIDESGKSLGPNQRGELCFKSDRIMKGYIDDDTATNDTIDKDGWLHSGDIGYYDDEKQFYIVDRLKELIKYKAFQVPPAEIEGLLLSSKKIKDCGVIGIPDEESGELPFAFVVKQPGVMLTEKEVQDLVAENASKPKWLRGGVRFIDEIPKNPSGKLLRRELRDLYNNTKPKL